jgi:hypothetical protein
MNGAATVFTSATQLAAPEALLENFLARPRNTASAAAFNREAARNLPRTTGALQLRALFCRMPSKLQSAVRQLIYERMVLEAKVEAVLTRLAEGEAAWGAEEGELALGSRGVDVLHRLQVAVADNNNELTRAVGKGHVRPVLEALWAPDMREALRLSVVSEAEAMALEGGGGGGGGGGARAAEADDGRSTAGWTLTGGARNASLDAKIRAARVWRRRLWKLTIPVRIDAKLRFATAHDDVDSKGHRSLINDLNRRTPEDGLSYYQKSKLAYGRERRGSTCIAGAWEGVVLPAAQAAAVVADEGAAAGAGLQYEDAPLGDEAALLEDEAALLAEVEQLSQQIQGRFASPRGAGGVGF